MGFFGWILSWFQVKEKPRQKSRSRLLPARQKTKQSRNIVAVSAKGATLELKSSYGFIYKAKQTINAKRRLSDDCQEQLKQLGGMVVRFSILTQELTTEEIFAAIFLVSEQRRWYVPGAEEKKNYLQRVLAVWHAPKGKCRIRQIHHGRYAGCWEIMCGIWCTHIPDSAIQNLERPGKPSAVKAFWQSHRRG